MSMLPRCIFERRIAPLVLLFLAMGFGAVNLRAQEDGQPSNPTKGTIRVNLKDGLKYVWIPAGTFTMGCSPGDSQCYPNEKPAHRVTITKGFWMTQTPVTAQAYKRFVAAMGRQMPHGPNGNETWADQDVPVSTMNWSDAQAYCGWIGGRLPTEAEWEYAARGGSTAARYGELEEVAWYYNNSGTHPHDVGKKPANAFGLYDMLGNIDEWVGDWYSATYYQNSPPKDPTGPATGQERVIRAGNWMEIPQSVRASYRFKLPPNLSSVSFGFRCAAHEVKSP